jgi:hypothetical protein
MDCVTNLSQDHKTDTVIQTTLRNELASDVTVLTISHRLQTIMDADKIVSRFQILLRHTNVTGIGGTGQWPNCIQTFYSPKLRSGRIRGSKRTSQERRKSILDESGDKAALYAMAELNATSSEWVFLHHNFCLLRM